LQLEVYFSIFNPSSFILTMKSSFIIRMSLLFIVCHCTSLQAQSISGVVNSFYKVNAINTATNTMTLDNTTGLVPGAKVLVIQMKGASMDNSNSLSFGNITAINQAGNYEFNHICTILGNDVLLQFKILNTYDPLESVQLVSVPVYTSVTITDTVKSVSWDPVSGKGGVAALEATDTLFMNSSIQVSGQGFQGGALMNYPIPPYNCNFVNITDYFLSVPTSDVFHSGGKKGEGIADYINNAQWGRGKQSNGGGGGNNNNTGGGGGGNYGAGGDGGQRINESAFSCHGKDPGIGGLALSAFAYSVGKNKIFMGGGGGSGHENNGVGLPGGNGGGIVILSAPVIMGTGNSILANGVSPLNPGNSDPLVAEGDGGGGGGAAGTIIINAGKIIGIINAEAKGARGSDASNGVPDCTGPGGGGGGGTIWAAGASFPAAIAATINGGNNGVVSVNSSKVPSCVGSSNGATPGGSGIAQAGYSAPSAAISVCSVLPLSDLDYFSGNLKSDGADLFWSVSGTNDIAYFQLESSTDQLNYSTLTTIENSGERKFSFFDPKKIDGTVFYRLLLIFKNGSRAYSPVVPLRRNTNSSLQLVSLQPNPVNDNLVIVLFSKKMSLSNFLVYNSYGQRLLMYAKELNAGYSKLNLPVSELPAGTYFLFVEGNNLQVVKPFVKAR
jgi:Secretion system C-terminal sorting domain